MDIQNDEKLKCARAGLAGAAYLEELGKFDLQTLSKVEWDTFVQCICMDYMVPF